MLLEQTLREFLCIKFNFARFFFTEFIALKYKKQLYVHVSQRPKNFRRSDSPKQNEPTHCPTTDFQPMIAEWIHECDLITASRRIVQRERHAPNKQQQ